MSLFRNAQRKLDWDWEHPSHSSRQDGEDSVPQVRDGESSTKEQVEYFGFQWEQNKTIVDIMGYEMWEKESNQGPGGRGGRFGDLHCTGQGGVAEVGKAGPQAQEIKIQISELELCHHWRDGTHYRRAGGDQHRPHQVEGRHGRGHRAVDRLIQPHA